MIMICASVVADFVQDCKANQSVTLWWRDCDQLFRLFASHEHAIRQMVFFGRSKTCFWLGEDVQDPPISSTILLSFLMSCASGQDDQHKACVPRHVGFCLFRNLHIAQHTAKDRDFHINNKHSNHKEHTKATLLFHRRNFHRTYKPYYWIKPDILHLTTLLLPLWIISSRILLVLCSISQSSTSSSSQHYPCFSSGQYTSSPPGLLSHRSEPHWITPEHQSLTDTLDTPDCISTLYGGLWVCQYTLSPSCFGI